MSEKDDHQKLVEEKIGQAEARAVSGLAAVRAIVWDLLVRELGFSPDDIETDKGFEVAVDDYRTIVSVDYLISMGDRRVMAIQCSPGALESRERHTVSFARIVTDYQIPLAVVTDGLRTRVLDVPTGRLLGEGLHAIPGKDALKASMQTMRFVPYPPEKIAREKRILLAFDSIKCTQESGE